MMMILMISDSPGTQAGGRLARARARGLARATCQRDWHPGRAGEPEVARDHGAWHGLPVVRGDSASVAGI